MQLTGSWVSTAAPTPLGPGLPLGGDHLNGPCSRVEYVILWRKVEKGEGEPDESELRPEMAIC